MLIEELVQFLGLEAERGFVHGGLVWDPSPDLHLGGVFGLMPDVFAGVYAELGFVRDIARRIEARIDIQFTYEDEIGPPPHFHPNEEQFVLVLDGHLRMILDGEVKELGPGDLIHVPRNISHTVRAVGGAARFFTCKHPVGDGELSQDYNEAPNAEELIKLLDEAG